MRFDVITIFPKILDSYVNESILKRAQKAGHIKIVTHDLRDFSDNRHKKVDDSPYGGGPGMVIQIAPVEKAVRFAERKLRSSLPVRQAGNAKRRTILFSTRGKIFNAAAAKRLSKYDQLIFICGRYEGVDERVAQYIADEEISIGDFVLSGGELPAAMVIEAVARQIPGVLGKYESLEEVKGSYPVYTRPEEYKLKVKSGKWKVAKVPAVLLGGNHKKIDEWRKRQR